MLDQYFLGMEGGYFGIGVVENRNDPGFAGRVQVRVITTHSAVLSDIPTADLPWAPVLQTSKSDPLELKEGDWVFLFWLDGPDMQRPLVMGVIPGYNTVPNAQGRGFNDLRSPSQLKLSPRPPVSRVYNSDGSGVTINEANAAQHYPSTSQVGRPTLSGASRYDYANTVIQDRIKNLDVNVQSAENQQWSEPYPAYNPLYPFNAAEQTEAGHVIEVDDTPGNERLSWTHRSGSFMEYYPTGSRVEKITRSKYSIVMGDDHVHVMGKVMITVGENAYIRVLGNASMEVGGTMNLSSVGEMSLSTAANLVINAASIQAYSTGDIVSIAKGNQHISSTGSIELQAVGNILETGAEVDILATSSSINASGANPMQVGGGGIQTTTLTASSVQTPSLSAANYNGAKAGSTPVTGNPVTVPSPTSAAQAQQYNTHSVGTPQPSGLPTFNDGDAPDEQINTPLMSANLNYFQAVAVKQNDLATSSGDTSATTQPANVSSSCSFDADDPVVKGEFISDSSQWNISQNGLQLITQQEGFSATAYTDADTVSIGYGTSNYSVPAGTKAGSVTFPISVGNGPITQAQGLQLMQLVINNSFLPALRQSINVPLTQNMIDALLSFMYNIGVPHFKSSSVCVYTNQKAYCSAYNSFALWNKSQGKVLTVLTNRRATEANLYIKT